MIVVDVNLLVYAHVSSFAQHGPARTWFEARLAGTERVGLPWHSLLGFLRIVTNGRIFAHPASFADAWGRVRMWLAQEVVWSPQPTDRHVDVLQTLLPHLGNRSDLVPDAHLAALAIEHGLIMCSTDGDFARFPALRWTNPLHPTG